MPSESTSSRLFGKHPPTTCRLASPKTPEIGTKLVVGEASVPGHREPRRCPLRVPSLVDLNTNLESTADLRRLATPKSGPESSHRHVGFAEDMVETAEGGPVTREPRSIPKGSHVSSPEVRRARANLDREISLTP